VGSTWIQSRRAIAEDEIKELLERCPRANKIPFSNLKIGSATVDYLLSRGYAGQGAITTLSYIYDYRGRSTLFSRAVSGTSPLSHEYLSVSGFPRLTHQLTATNLDSFISSLCSLPLLKAVELDARGAGLPDKSATLRRSAGRRYFEHSALRPLGLEHLKLDAWCPENGTSTESVLRFERLVSLVWKIGMGPSPRKRVTTCLRVMRMVSEWKWSLQS